MVNNLKKLHIFTIIIGLIISLNCKAAIFVQEYRMNALNGNVNIKDINKLRVDGNFLINTYEEIIFDNVSGASIKGDFIC